MQRETEADRQGRQTGQRQTDRPIGQRQTDMTDKQDRDRQTNRTETDRQTEWKKQPNVIYIKNKTRKNIGVAPALGRSIIRQRENLDCNALSTAQCHIRTSRNNCKIGNKFLTPSQPPL